MRAIDRLPMVIDALTEAYDLVVVECGAADAASIARIARAERGEIILSILRSGEAEIDAWSARQSLGKPQQRSMSVAVAAVKRAVTVNPFLPPVVTCAPSIRAPAPQNDATTVMS